MHTGMVSDAILTVGPDAPAVYVRHIAGVTPPKSAKPTIVDGRIHNVNCDTCKIDLKTIPGEEIVDIFDGLNFCSWVCQGAYK